MILGLKMANNVIDRLWSKDIWPELVWFRRDACFTPDDVEVERNDVTRWLVVFGMGVDDDDVVAGTVDVGANDDLVETVDDWGTKVYTQSYWTCNSLFWSVLGDAHKAFVWQLLFNLLI